MNSIPKEPISATPKAAAASDNRRSELSYPTIAIGFRSKMAVTGILVFEKVNGSPITGNLGEELSFTIEKGGRQPRLIEFNPFDGVCDLFQELGLGWWLFHYSGETPEGPADVWIVFNESTRTGHLFYTQHYGEPDDGFTLDRTYAISGSPWSPCFLPNRNI